MSGQKKAWLVKAKASRSLAVKRLMVARYAMYQEGYDTTGIARIIRQVMKAEAQARIDRTA